MTIPSHDYQPVLRLPAAYDVLDFTAPQGEQPPRRSPYSVGRYGEVRPTLYDQPMFSDDRVLHLGVDLGGPVGTPVFAFWWGWIASLADLDRPGDYGATIVTGHHLGPRTLYALHGHLSRRSLDRWSVGDPVETGQELGELGSPEENGGWPPHVHFQLSWVAPVDGDIPGLARLEEREEALKRFPDPAVVLGRLYP